MEQTCGLCSDFSRQTQTGLNGIVDTSFSEHGEYSICKIVKTAKTRKRINHLCTCVIWVCTVY